MKEVTQEDVITCLNNLQEFELKLKEILYKISMLKEKLMTKINDI